MISNGVVVNFISDSDDSFVYKTAYTYSENDVDGKEECESIQNMFWDILEKIRPNSKHNKFNIKIEVSENT